MKPGNGVGTVYWGNGLGVVNKVPIGDDACDPDFYPHAKVVYPRVDRGDSEDVMVLW